MKFVGLMLALSVSACQTSPQVDAERVKASASAAAQPGPVAKANAPPSGAQQDLDALDKRKPVPLLPMMAHHQKQNMRDHLMAVQEVVGALAKDDFDAAAKAAERLGPSEQMKRMCSHMGSRTPGFTPRALAFHETAAGIKTAAEAKDTRKALSVLSGTLKACNGCHATYKQNVVDMKQWSKMPTHDRAK